MDVRDVAACISSLRKMKRSTGGTPVWYLEVVHINLKQFREENGLEERLLAIFTGQSEGWGPSVTSHRSSFNLVAVTVSMGNYVTADVHNKNVFVSNFLDRNISHFRFLLWRNVWWRLQEQSVEWVIFTEFVGRPQNLVLLRTTSL